MILTDRLLCCPFFLTQWQNSCSRSFLILLITLFCFQFTAVLENFHGIGWRFSTPWTCGWGFLPTPLPHERMLANTNQFDLKLLLKLQVVVTPFSKIPKVIFLVWQTFFESLHAQYTTYITHRLEFRVKNYRLLPISKTFLTHQWEASLQTLSK